MTISTEHMQERFRKAVDSNCKGMIVAVGCLGEKCEHAKVDRDDSEVAQAAEDLIECMDESIERLQEPFDSAEFRGLLKELREVLEPVDVDHQCEPSFSWSSCDSCGSSFGGDRHAAFGNWIEGEVPNQKFKSVEMSICTDCVMAHANGDQPEHWEEFPGQNEECEA